MNEGSRWITLSTVLLNISVQCLVRSQFSPTVCLKSHSFVLWISGSEFDICNEFFYVFCVPENVAWIDRILIFVACLWQRKIFCVPVASYHFESGRKGLIGTSWWVFCCCS